MKSFLHALVTVIVLPAAASAATLDFDCNVEDAAQPEMAARLTQVDDQPTGTIRIAGGEMEALIYEGADTRTFLFLGDDYSLNYTVNITTGAYEYFADGSRAAEATGTCLPATDTIATENGSDLKS